MHAGRWANASVALLVGGARFQENNEKYALVERLEVSPCHTATLQIALGCTCSSCIHHSGFAGWPPRLLKTFPFIFLVGSRRLS